MASLGVTLDICKNTLFMSQALLQTASHNIANAENTAYARQSVIVQAARAQRGSGGFFGLGSQVSSVVQARDGFIEARLRETVSGGAGESARSGVLSLAQARLAADGQTGVSGALGAFFDAWDTLNENPEGASEKALLTQRAGALAASLRETAQGFSALASDTAGGISAALGEAQNLISRIATLNADIRNTETPGAPANDLRDSRYAALTELSALLPVEAREEADGTLTLTLPDGARRLTLLSGDEPAFRLSFDGGAVRYESVSTSGGVDFTPETNAIKGGRIGGLLLSLSHLSEYGARLDDFASAFVSRVNAAHSAGGGGLVFNGGTAGTISVDPLFSPDADAALSVSGLQEEKIASLSGATFSGALSALASSVGSDLSDASTRAGYLASLREDLSARQQAVSGVSLDEEMIEILKHQQLYQAAAKLISQTAEMLNTAIQMVR